MKDSMYQKIATTFHTYLERVLTPYNAEMKAVKAEVASLKAEVAALKSEMREHEYKGIFKDGETYKRHNSATRDGNLYICRVAQTTERPAESHDWKLAVRSGRDAR